MRLRLISRSVWGEGAAEAVGRTVGARWIRSTDHHGMFHLPFQTCVLAHADHPLISHSHCLHAPLAHEYRRRHCVRTLGATTTSTLRPPTIPALTQRRESSSQRRASRSLTESARSPARRLSARAPPTPLPKTTANPGRRAPASAPEPPLAGDDDDHTEWLWAGLGDSHRLLGARWSSGRQRDAPRIGLA